MLTLTEQSELKVRNERLEEEAVQHERRIEKHLKVAHDLRQELAYVKRQLEALKRKLFGQSRAEQISEAQLQLARNELEKEIAEHEAVDKEVIAYTRVNPSPRRPPRACRRNSKQSPRRSFSSRCRLSPRRMSASENR